MVLCKAIAIQMVVASVTTDLLVRGVNHAAKISILSDATPLAMKFLTAVVMGAVLV